MRTAARIPTAQGRPAWEKAPLGGPPEQAWPFWSLRKERDFVFVYLKWINECYQGLLSPENCPEEPTEEPGKYWRGGRRNQVHC